mmetsp:Transcript_9721/g.24163  ORF Transcript_9721/g.24163 Transcript_9721/m.24163 type:complete len:214 (-) Transcript_9721:345-986(-)
MAALHRAVALVQVHHVAVVVGQDLDLNVARVLHVLLNEHAPVAERRLGLVGGARERVRQLAVCAHDTHAAAAATHGRLEDDGVAVLVRKCLRLVGRGDGLVGAGHHGHAALHGGAAGSGLVAHGLDGLWHWAHKRDARLGALARKRRVLAQEAVAGVDAVHVGCLGDADDGVNVQVAGHGLHVAAADLVRLVSLVAVGLQAVSRAVHSNRAKS